MGTYQREFRLVTVNSYPESKALKLQFTTPVTYNIHTNAVVFTVLNPQKADVRILERNSTKPIGCEYRREDFEVLPGYEHRITFYTFLVYIRMVITRNRCTGNLSTRFESGYTREL